MNDSQEAADSFATAEALSVLADLLEAHDVDSATVKKFLNDHQHLPEFRELADEAMRLQADFTAAPAVGTQEAKPSHAEFPARRVIPLPPETAPAPSAESLWQKLLSYAAGLAGFLVFVGIAGSAVWLVFVSQSLRTELQVTKNADIEGQKEIVKAQVSLGALLGQGDSELDMKTKLKNSQSQIAEGFKHKVPQLKEWALNDSDAQVAKGATLLLYNLCGSKARPEAQEAWSALKAVSVSAADDTVKYKAMELLADLETPVPSDEPTKLDVRFGNRGEFGFEALERIKDHEFRRRLTYSPKGETNDAALLVGKKVVHFGSGVGHWEFPLAQIPDAKENHEYFAIWKFDKISVTQRLRKLPGSIKKLETFQVQFQIVNDDSTEHDVGFRFLLDTLIGANDAPPGALPDAKKLIVKSWQAVDESVPAFLSFRQFESLEKPGLTAYLSLRSIRGAEKIDRVQIVALPSDLDDWESPFQADQDLRADSVVLLYWNKQKLAAHGGTRTITFAYGLDVLGKFSSEKSKAH